MTLELTEKQLDMLSYELSLLLVSDVTYSPEFIELIIKIETENNKIKGNI